MVSSHCGKLADEMGCIVDTDPGLVMKFTVLLPHMTCVAVHHGLVVVQTYYQGGEDRGWDGDEELVGDARGSGCEAGNHRAAVGS